MLVKHRNVKALAAGLCVLIEDPAKRAALGARAAETVLDYDRDRLAQTWDRLFTELAQNR